MLREVLATYAHEAWSQWMRYLFGKCISQPDGSVVIPAEFVQRWRRQMQHTFSELPKNEQKSDLDEADFMLQIINSQDCEHDFHDTDGQGGPGEVCVKCGLVEGTFLYCKRE
jgi:hypothetical protein